MVFQVLTAQKWLSYIAANRMSILEEIEISRYKDKFLVIVFLLQEFCQKDFLSTRRQTNVIILLSNLVRFVYQIQLIQNVFTTEIKD
jgi:hypothetical protein